MHQNKSLFLAKGQARASEMDQDVLDAWNRQIGYGNSGTPQSDDWSKADKFERTVLKIMDDQGTYALVHHNGTKYVFRDTVNAVA